MSVNALRLPNPTKQPIARSQRLFEDLQRRFQNRELASHDDVRGALYESLQVFFRHAAEPVFKSAELLDNQPRKRDDFLTPMRAIADDLAVQYMEAQALTDSITATFNFQNTLLESLFGRLKRAGSTLIDLQISQDRFNEAVIVAGDDFTDDSRLDPNATLSLSRADINPLGNLLTLRRTSNESAVTQGNVAIRVDPLQNYRDRLYEGQFYGLVGQAVPEGGRFHFQEKAAGESARDSLPQDLLNRFRGFFESNSLGAAAAKSTIDATEKAIEQGVTIAQALVQSRSSGSFGGFSETEWELLAGQIHNQSELFTILGGEVPEFIKALEPSRAIVDNGATLEERRSGRLAMIDGDSDTFWQVEYVRPVRPDALKVLRDGDEMYPERAGFISEVLQQQSREFDTLDLDVRVVIDLGAPTLVNWVDLVPMLFDGIEHMEILSFATSRNGRDYDEVSQTSRGSTGNKIARDSNATLSGQMSQAILASSASAFAGRGLWVFAPRAVRFLRFDIRQPVPVITPYHLLALQLSRTVRRRHSRGTTGRRRSSTQTTETRTVELSYPETVEVTGGTTDPATAAQARGARRITAESEIDKLLDGSVNLSTINQSIREFASLTRGLSSRGRTSIGNENIDKQWVETKWDRKRWAIAIRDIGIWRYNFEEASEFVSIKYRSPEPIRDISLEVDELIPKEFLEGREITAFIDYFIGFGDGQDWLPIAPLTGRTVRTLEGNALPTVIHVNSGIPPAERAPAEGYIDLDNEVKEVRLRAILRRPVDIPEADNFTPALKSYRLTWTVRGGFR